jgi:hypothetical protein
MRAPRGGMQAAPSTARSTNSREASLGQRGTVRALLGGQRHGAASPATPPGAGPAAEQAGAPAPSPLLLGCRNDGLA